MALFGHVTQGAVKATPMSADRKFSLRTQAPEDGVVTALFADLQNDGTEIQAFRMGIYNDAPTMSGASLVDASDVVLLSPTMARTWVAFNSGINANVVGGNIYWLTLQAGTTGGNASFWYDSGVGSELLADDIFSDGLSSTFGVSTSAVNSIALYAGYTPVGGSGGASSGIGRVARGSVGWK
jgi:hypothetical protein